MTRLIPISVRPTPEEVRSFLHRPEDIVSMLQFPHDWLLNCEDGSFAGDTGFIQGVAAMTISSAMLAGFAAPLPGKTSRTNFA